MPRHQPVDYPQVARPTAQSYLEVQNAANNRFSWQEGPPETRAEHTDISAGNTERSPSVSPLAVLPNPAVISQQQVQHPQAAFHPQGQQQQFQQEYFLQHAPHQTYSQPSQSQQFRPDMPRHLQQYAEQQQHAPAGTIPSYEASQAAHQNVQEHQLQQGQVAQEQAGYPSHQGQQYHQYHQQQPHPQQLQQQSLPTHTQYAQHQQVTAVAEYQSSEEKPEQTMPRQIHSHIAAIGPDSNPLSPTSPASPASFHQTTNIQTYPPPASAMTFSQSTPYEQYNSTTGGTWHHGLGSCSEPGTCLSALFCPCVIYGRTRYRLGLKAAKKDPTNMLGYSFINGSCLAWSLLCGVNMLMTAFQHRHIRKTYEMDITAGNALNDCLTSACCCCCVLAQDEKEMKLRESKARKGDTTIDHGYTSPTAMNFSAHT